MTAIKTGMKLLKRWKGGWTNWKIISVGEDRKWSPWHTGCHNVLL